jgi:hypothetical protein
MMLVQPINEFPEPIAYRTHKIGLKLVKDLSVARRFIMKKLAVAMLNIVDQFHSEVFFLLLCCFFSSSDGNSYLCSCFLEISLVLSNLS